MSQAFKPSQNEGDSSHSEYKQPDLIIIDDESSDPHQNYSSHSEKNSNQEQTNGAPTYQNTTVLRLICLVGFVVCLITAIATLALFVLALLFSLLTFFSNTQANQSLYSCWKVYLNLIVMTLGFGLGMLFPRIGLGLLVVYFSVKDDMTNPNTWRQIFRRSFS